jgi:hypothetical protein
MGACFANVHRREKIDDRFTYLHIFSNNLEEVWNKQRIVCHFALFQFYSCFYLISEVYTVPCFVFGRGKTWRSCQTDLLGVVKWRGVGVSLFGTSVWWYLRRRRMSLDPTSCRSDSLPAYLLKYSTAKRHCTVYEYSQIHFLPHSKHPCSLIQIKHPTRCNNRSSNLLLSRIDAAQHVSGIMPNMRSSFKLQPQPPVSIWMPRWMCFQSWSVC